jgi:hypothetical protein
MSLDEPQKNKMLQAPPAKKGFHFSATTEHFAEFIEAETIEEATAIYHRVKRLINPAPAASSTPPAAELKAEEGIQ